MTGAPTIAVLGAGSWGTALAILLSRNGAEVRLWSHLQTQVDSIRRDGENSEFLPRIPLPQAIQVTADLTTALDRVDEVLVVVPSHAFREVLQAVAGLLPADAPVSWATKGLEPHTGHLLHQVAAEVLGQRPLAVISGPSFAIEVARGLPTAITVAADTRQHAERLAGYLYSDCFRPYTSSDITGLEVGGAAKNVMAIAAGIADGLGFGANTRAALITRGLAEIMRFGIALGGKQETLMGLGGLGDLVLTCTDDQSRNRRMGLALAEGKTVEDTAAEIGQVVEGVKAAAAVHKVAADLEIEMPICQQVYRLIYEGTTVEQAIQSLMQREVKSESDA